MLAAHPANSPGKAPIDSPMNAASPPEPGMPPPPTGAEPTSYALPDGMSLLAVLREDFSRHDRDWTLPGFRAVAVHRLGFWHRGLRFAPLRVLVRRVHLSLYRRVRNHYGIELPYTVTLGRRVRFEHQGGIVIHGFTRLGDDCVVRQGVTMGVRSPDEPFQAPVLGDRVDVGAGAVILGGVRIGDGARIGANAVVLRDVPPNATAVGIPARVIERGAT